MKKNTFSLLKSSALVLTLVLMGIFSSKTFAAYSIPAGCGILAEHHLPSSWSGGGLSYMIYVFSGDYTITSNIEIDECSVIVVHENSTGAKLTFQNGSYISSITQANIIVRGFDVNRRLELVNGNNSPGAIILQNVNNAIISYTTISGFNNTFGGIAFSNVTNSKISHNRIINNIYGISFQSNSINNEISNNEISNNINEGISLQLGSHNTNISYTTLNNNGGAGVSVTSSNGFIISHNTGDANYNGIYINGTVNTGTIRDNTFTNNTYAGITVNNNISGLTISNNKTTNNFIGLDINGSKNNNFNGNIISGNSYGANLQNSASGNIFTNDNISFNSNNVYLDNSHNNKFTDTTIQSGSRGIWLATNSNYNTFSNVNVVNNTNGTKLNASSHNTLNLTNNNNGIILDGGSDNNSIYNKQTGNTAALANNITINNGSNNVITGGLFADLSTPTTTVNIKLKNDQSGSKSYTITGTDLSGTYAGVMAGSTETVAIEFSGANGIKNIEVTYINGNNKQYDSITLGTVTPPYTPGSSGGGGGGGSIIATCTTSQLVCSSGTRVLASGASCQSVNLGNACIIGTGTLPIGSIAGSPFSTELNNAYLRGFANGITTMNTIQKANMTGSLIRSHMAKMISNFAISLGGLTPNTGASCTFSDIANQSTEMKFYIKLACQLGLMGQDISKFDPSSVVTRAQFGTILSRVIWGNRYEGGVKYYTNHLAALKNVGIMTKIENPTEKEIRGYVMIMMKRTYDGGYLD